MAARWHKNRSKKQLHTTLGKAPHQEKPVDVAHLRQPINTSIFGLKNVISLFQTATEEVQDYITYECDVLYECRICRTLFRSLANFILHKRSFCTEKYSVAGTNNSQQASAGYVIEDDSRPVTPVQNEDCAKSSSEEFSLMISSDESEKPDDFKTTGVFLNDQTGEITAENADKPEKNDKKVDTVPSKVAKDKKFVPKKALDGVIDKLLKKQGITEMVQDALTEDLSNKKQTSEEEDDDVIFVSEEKNVMLEKIDSSHAAVFQTVLDEDAPQMLDAALMKSEVMEIHGIFGDNEVVLDSDGKVCNFKTNKISNLKNSLSDQDLVCSECNLRFSTPKTLTHHIKYKHNQSCIVYPCPDCREPFANAWGVYRHLYKVHRRTAIQVKRMRAQIHASGVRKDNESLLKKKEKETAALRENEENQWLDNLEEQKKQQMCGGCGKKFERKAALHSHLQMCTKKSAAVLNAKNKNVIENGDKVAENTEDNGGMKPKGAARRKAYLGNKQQKFAPVPEIIKKIFNDESGKSVKNSEPSTVSPVLSTITETNSVMTENPLKRKRRRPKGMLLEQAVKKKSEVVGQKPKKKRRATVTTDSRKKTVSEPLDNNKITIISDSEDKHENSTDTSIPLKHLNIDDLSKQTETPTTDLETFTISDDSLSDSERAGPQTELVLVQENTAESSDLNEEASNSSLQLFNFFQNKLDMPATEINKPSSNKHHEYTDFLNDEADECFFENIAPFIDSNELKCLSCDHTYLSQFQLLTHMSLHLDWYRFQCSKCSFLSFNKFDCTSHATQEHGTPSTLMNCTVLPIPKWKVLQMAHNFTPLLRDVTNDNEVACNLELANVGVIELDEDDVEERTMPHLEPAVQVDNDFAIEDEINTPPEVGEEVSIVLNDSNSNNDDDDAIEDKTDSKTGQNSDEEAGSSEKVVNNLLGNRPIRNRTKCYKTLQDDFIYDLGKVLKLNDCSNKYKLKKGVSK